MRRTLLYVLVKARTVQKGPCGKGSWDGYWTDNGNSTQLHGLEPYLQTEHLHPQYPMEHPMEHPTEQIPLVDAAENPTLRHCTEG